ncbi:Phosphoenolpyruvate carboxylase 1 [Datura stramonium]|uniref:Phosphoenolpyruvate carboxylase 1 n=1 Tax=Datura stramonium TaxID=4076 RepID=A0ABS8TIB1_DATST|nr:Phosphoenolpyruvate carboxylase 1 [Datura stramonium]
MANRNLEKLASIDAQLRLLVPAKVSEDDKLVEYDALLLDRFLDILQDLHGEGIKETVQECYELSAEYGSDTVDLVFGSSDSIYPKIFASEACKGSTPIAWLQLYAKDITPDDKQELDEEACRGDSSCFPRTDEIRRTPSTPQDEIESWNELLP